MTSNISIVWANCASSLAVNVAAMFCSIQTSRLFAKNHTVNPPASCPVKDPAAVYSNFAAKAVQAKDLTRFAASPCQSVTDGQAGARKRNCIM
jgi:hypothetical protein